ncbi:beta-1,3-galactosyltransferase 1-like [Ruditapes philippinarum]|uniref:beta-1,3-galactosyltransferase 1-like n=1 Tax=Ruditapes philippinarum TaxID=129788 RepID=UPI00295AA335|nr:beta-1,3-galactosyltransferase 1-like [Ruditapes philippinarum]
MQRTVISSFRIRKKILNILLICVIGLVTYASLHIMLSNNAKIPANIKGMHMATANSVQHLLLTELEQFTRDSEKHQTTERIIRKEFSAGLKEDIARLSNQNHNNKDNYVPLESQKTNVTINENKSFQNKNAQLKRQPSCSSCFKHNFNYVIQNKNICQLYSSNQTIELLVLIMTTHKNNRARAALRSTWLSVTKHNKGNVRYAFLLGEITDKWQKEAVLEENNIHHDIIKEDFIDTYMNLTYKTIMGFKWATYFCQTALYVMKTDDDMFVNISNLLKMLTDTNKEKLQTSVMGACLSREKPIRSNESKWFASYESYPDEFYPTFCSGTGYVTSMHVVNKIYLISPNIPFFHLEDIYVSFCVRALGFEAQSMPGFKVDPVGINACVYKGDYLITAHRITTHMLQDLWNSKCDRKYMKLWYLLVSQFIMVIVIIIFYVGVFYIFKRYTDICQYFTSVRERFRLHSFK